MDNLKHFLIVTHFDMRNGFSWLATDQHSFGLCWNNSAITALAVGLNKLVNIPIVGEWSVQGKLDRLRIDKWYPLLSQTLSRLINIDHATVAMQSLLINTSINIGELSYNEFKLDDVFLSFSECKIPRLCVATLRRQTFRIVDFFHIANTRNLTF